MYFRECYNFPTKPYFVIFVFFFFKLFQLLFDKFENEHCINWNWFLPLFCNMRFYLKSLFFNIRTCNFLSDLCHQNKKINAIIGKIQFNAIDKFVLQPEDVRFRMMSCNFALIWYLMYFPPGKWSKPNSQHWLQMNYSNRTLFVWTFCFHLKSSQIENMAQNGSRKPTYDRGEYVSCRYKFQLNY